MVKKNGELWKFNKGRVVTKLSRVKVNQHILPLCPSLAIRKLASPLSLKKQKIQPSPDVGECSLARLLDKSIGLHKSVTASL